MTTRDEDDSVNNDISQFIILREISSIFIVNRDDDDGFDDVLFIRIERYSKSYTIIESYKPEKSSSMVMRPLRNEEQIIQ